MGGASEGSEDFIEPGFRHSPTAPPTCFSRGRRWAPVAARWEGLSLVGRWWAGSSPGVKDLKGRRYCLAQCTTMPSLLFWGLMNKCMNLTVTGGYRGAVYAARCLERFPNSSTSGKGSSGREGALAPSCLGVPSGASGVLRAFLTPAYRCLLPQSLTHGFSPVWVHGGVGRAGQLTPELERRSVWFRRGRLR